MRPWCSSQILFFILSAVGMRILVTATRHSFQCSLLCQPLSFPSSPPSLLCFSRILCLIFPLSKHHIIPNGIAGKDVSPRGTGVFGNHTRDFKFVSFIAMYVSFKVPQKKAGNI